MWEFLLCVLEQHVHLIHPSTKCRISGCWQPYPLRKKRLAPPLEPKMLAKPSCSWDPLRNALNLMHVWDILNMYRYIIYIYIYHIHISLYSHICSRGISSRCHAPISVYVEYKIASRPEFRAPQLVLTHKDLFRTDGLDKAFGKGHASTILVLSENRLPSGKLT